MDSTVSAACGGGISCAVGATGGTLTLEMVGLPDPVTATEMGVTGGWSGQVSGGTLAVPARSPALAPGDGFELVMLQLVSGSKTAYLPVEYWAAPKLTGASFSSSGGKIHVSFDQPTSARGSISCALVVANLTGALFPCPAPAAFLFSSVCRYTCCATLCILVSHVRLLADVAETCLNSLDVVCERSIALMHAILVPGLGSNPKCDFSNTDGSLSVSLGFGASIMPGEVMTFIGGELALSTATVRSANGKSTAATRADANITRPLVKKSASPRITGPTMISDCDTAKLQAVSDSPRPVKTIWECINSPGLIATGEGVDGQLSIAGARLSPGTDYQFQATVTTFLGAISKSSVHVISSAAAGSAPPPILEISAPSPPIRAQNDQYFYALAT